MAFADELEDLQFAVGQFVLRRARIFAWLETRLEKDPFAAKLFAHLAELQTVVAATLRTGPRTSNRLRLSNSPNPVVEVRPPRCSSTVEVVAAGPARWESHSSQNQA